MKEKLTDLTCADCGFTARAMTAKALRDGSTVREPGEALCEGCSSARVLLVRRMDATPNNIADIRAKRMYTGVGKGLAS